MRWLSGWTRRRPSSTASIAGAASSSIRMNHCSQISGSIRSPERCEYGTACMYCSVRAIRPSSRSAATTASRASSAVMPGKRSRRVLVHPPVLADHDDLLEPVRAADLEVVRVVARA